MGIIHDWWPHITAFISVAATWLMREKVFTALKWLITRIMPDHINALDVHAKEDKVQFENIGREVKDVKAYIADVKADVIQALGQNIGYLRDDLKTERASSEKRFEFLEKVYLDSRLDKR